MQPLKLQDSISIFIIIFPVCAVCVCVHHMLLRKTIFVIYDIYFQNKFSNFLGSVDLFTFSIHTTKQVLRINVLIVCHYFQHFNCDGTIQTYNFRYLYPCAFIHNIVVGNAERVFSETFLLKKQHK